MRPDAEGCQARRLLDRPARVYKEFGSAGGATMRIHRARGFAALVALTILPAVAASPPAAPAAKPGGIRIKIKNEYKAELNFGPLGHASREGTDTADGVLKFQGGEYVGTVTAWVSSTQTLVGPGGFGNCGPGTYRNSQELQVTGLRVGGFNDLVQTVPRFNSGTPSSEYIILEFAPAPGVELQPPNPNPDQDQVINCHTIIETEAGRFLPFNDTRWTMKGGGYTIVLPSSGTLYYTDETVPTGSGTQLGPFDAQKSVWTIEVERLPK